MLKNRQILTPRLPQWVNFIKFEGQLEIKFTNAINPSNATISAKTPSFSVLYIGYSVMLWCSDFLQPIFPGQGIHTHRVKTTTRSPAFHPRPFQLCLSPR